MAEVVLVEGPLPVKRLQILPSEATLRYWHLSRSFRNRGNPITVAGLMDGFKRVMQYAEPRLLHNLAEKCDQQLDDVIMMRRRRNTDAEIVTLDSLKSKRIEKLHHKIAQLQLRQQVKS